MTKTKIALLLAVVLFAAGCSASGVDTHDGDDGDHPEQAPQTTDDPEQAMLDRMDEVSPRVGGISDDVLISAAEQACQGFDAGLTPDLVFQYAFDEGLDNEAAGVIIGGGVHYLCPEYAPAFDAWNSAP